MFAMGREGRAGSRCRRRRCGRRSSRRWTGRGANTCVIRSEAAATSSCRGVRSKESDGSAGLAVDVGLSRGPAVRRSCDWPDARCTTHQTRPVVSPVAPIQAAPEQRRRHHVFDTTIQRAVADAARRAGWSKRVTPHTRHPLPPNSRPGLLALRTRVAWRYFGHGDGPTPPPADFGGVEVPAIHGYAVESWLLRNRLVGVRPSHQL